VFILWIKRERQHPAVVSSAMVRSVKLTVKNGGNFCPFVRAARAERLSGTFIGKGIGEGDGIGSGEDVGKDDASKSSSSRLSLKKLLAISSNSKVMGDEGESAAPTVSFMVEEGGGRREVMLGVRVRFFKKSKKPRGSAGGLEGDGDSMGGGGAVGGHGDGGRRGDGGGLGSHAPSFRSICGSRDSKNDGGMICCRRGSGSLQPQSPGPPLSP